MFWKRILPAPGIGSVFVRDRADTRAGWRTSRVKMAHIPGEDGAHPRRRSDRFFGTVCVNYAGCLRYVLLFCALTLLSPLSALCRRMNLS